MATRTAVHDLFVARGSALAMETFKRVRSEVFPTPLGQLVELVSRKHRQC